MGYNSMENQSIELLLQMQGKRKEIQDYLAKHVNTFIQPLIYEIVKKRPTDPAKFAFSWLQEHLTKRQVQSHESDSDNDLDEVPFDENKLLKRKQIGKKVSRRGISEEVFGNFNPKERNSVRSIPKSQQIKVLILSLIRSSILFQNLDERDQMVVVDAMEEIQVKEGDTIINEGEKGDSLFVVADGDFDCFKKIQGESRFLKTYHCGEAFGELALMYNAPRAATIISKTSGKLYALDRIAFSQIVKAAACKKRELYQKVMEKVDIFSELSQYEREQFYDVLREEKYESGEYVIRQGEKGNEFYIIVEGMLVAQKKEEGDEFPKIVYQYKEGDYFGELALLHDQPRQASVKAVGRSHVAKIERDTFKRLLGSLQDILKRNEERYKKIQEEITA